MPFSITATVPIRHRTLLPAMTVLIAVCLLTG